MTRIEWAVNISRDEHFNAVLNELREAEMQRFASSDPMDIDAREQAYQKVRCLNELQAHIEGLAMTATMKERRWKIL